MHFAQVTLDAAVVAGGEVTAVHSTHVRLPAQVHRVDVLRQADLDECGRADGTVQAVLGGGVGERARLEKGVADGGVAGRQRRTRRGRSRMVKVTDRRRAHHKARLRGGKLWNWGGASQGGKGQGSLRRQRQKMEGSRGKVVVVVNGCRSLVGVVAAAGVAAVGRPAILTLSAGVGGGGRG